MIAVDEPGNLRRLAALQRRFREAAVPVSGGVEITRRCNLRCVHCYLGDERAAPPAGREELDAAAWPGLIERVAAAGCLELVFTGGEPLLRPDFAEVYALAHRAGISLTLFTNATLVDDRTVSLLRALPPAGVEVSIYGAGAATHDRVTGVAGSFAAALAGIGRLARCGVPLTVKSVLMTLNLAEFGGMQRIAAEHGARWRFDPAIFPRLDGDRSPLALRVPPETAARLDIGDARRAREWRGCYEAGRDLPPSRLLYTCGAGTTNFHVDPYGALLPCVMSRSPAADLRSREFAAAWREVVAAVARLEAPAGYRCNSCDRRNICGLCPPFFELEGGRADGPSEYLCALGDRRRELMYTFP